MRKAIQVTNQLDVEELNKLFEQGYTVESVDEHGVYILKFNEKQPTTLIACDDKMVDLKEITKSEPIKRKPIDDQLSTNITLDTTQAQRAFDLLGESVKQIKDGERDYDYNNKHTIVIIKRTIM